MTLPALPTLDFDPFDPAHAGDLRSGVVDWTRVAARTPTGAQVDRPFLGSEAARPTSFRGEVAGRPSSVYLIYNIFGGGGAEDSVSKLRALALFESLLNEQSIKVTKIKTERPGHAKDIVRDIVPADTELLCVWGGDGTVQEAVTGLMQRKDDLAKRVPLALVAGGSGNAVAAVFGYRRDFSDKNSDDSLETRVRRTVSAILNGRLQKMDIGKITLPKEPSRLPMYTLLIAHWGAGLELLLTAETLRKKYSLGEQRYILAALYHLLYKNYPVRPPIKITIDDQYEVELPKAWNSQVTEIVVANFSSMRGFSVSPLAQGDDGKFEAQVLPAMPKPWLRRFSNLQTKGKQFISKTPPQYAPLYFRFSKMRVEWVDSHQKAYRRTDNEMAVDGTLLGLAFPYEIECISGAITFCVPANLPGLR